MDVALDFIEKGSPLDLELFFAVAWSIWWNRNQAAHEDLGTTPSQVWEMANRLLSEYKDACTLLALSLAPSLTAWQAPPSSFFKINTNGAALDGSLLALVWLFVIIGALSLQHQAKFCQLLSLPRSQKLWHCKMVCYLHWI